MADGTSGGALDDWLTRDQALAGLPGRRAGTLLFLIESRTAHLVAESSEAMVPVQWEEGKREREHAFLEAFTLGRDPPLRPTIRDIERHVSGWLDLVPESAERRAALANQLGEKYRMPKRFVPGIRAALRLDDADVRSAFERANGRPLDAIYAPQLSLADLLRWGWTRVAVRLESLPPFWMAYSLILTETVGTGILALPIAVAGVGSLAGVALLIAIGLVNILTITALAESFSRNVGIRYGTAYFGRLVAEYLGTAGSFVLSIVLMLLCVFALLAYYVGLAHTLYDATSVPYAVWCALLFLMTLFFIRRHSATLAAAVLVGAATIVLIFILSLIALAHLQTENLLRVNVPAPSGASPDLSVLDLIFGVILLAFLGHLSIGNCARVVLHRDPSARALIRGAAAAQATAIVLYCVWVVAVIGATQSQALQDLHGTALSALADVAGPSVHILGGIYVVLVMGMASVHVSEGLMNLVRERFPTRARRASLEELHLPRAGEPALLRFIQNLTMTTNASSLYVFIPLLAVFLLAEGLFFTGTESFAELHSLSGVLVAPVLAGFLPIMLLTASERKSDFALNVGWPGPRHQLLKIALYGVFLADLLLHGLVLWDGPERLGALLVAALVIGATIAMSRRGAFAPRMVLQIRQDGALGNRTFYSVVRAGVPVPASVRLVYPDGARELEAAEAEIPAFAELRSASFELPAGDARDFKVWVHRVTAAGEAEPLPAVVDVDYGEVPRRRVDLTETDGEALLPIARGICQLTVTFPN